MTQARITEERLADSWFGFMQKLLASMQRAFIDQGITQKGVAERLGKDPGYISRCFSGRQNMTVRTAHDIARAMDCRLDLQFVPLKSLVRANNQPAPLSETNGAGGRSFAKYLEVKAA